MIVAPLDLDWLARFHAREPLQLRPAGAAAFVYVREENPIDERQSPTDEDGFAYVTELIRLARLGAAIEAQGDRL